MSHQNRNFGEWGESEAVNLSKNNCFGGNPDLICKLWMRFSNTGYPRLKCQAKKKTNKQTKKKPKPKKTNPKEP